MKTKHITEIRATVRAALDLRITMTIRAVALRLEVPLPSEVAGVQRLVVRKTAHVRASASFLHHFHASTCYSLHVTRHCLQWYATVTYTDLPKPVCKLLPAAIGSMLLVKPCPSGVQTNEYLSLSAPMNLPQNLPSHNPSYIPDTTATSLSPVIHIIPIQHHDEAPFCPVGMLLNLVPKPVSQRPKQ